MKPTHILGSLLLLFPGSTAHLQAQQVTISPGLYITATGAPNLVFNNLGFTNNGHFKAAASTVIFTDSTNTRPVLINGNSKTSFYQLAIGQDVQLQQNIVVTSNLYLNRGNLQLNQYNIDLAQSGTIIGERNESRIMGKESGTVTRTANLQSPQQVNPGNIGVSITSAANLGHTVITRGHASPIRSAPASIANRYFNIAPAFNHHLNASLQFHYLETELTGNENELTLFASEGYGWKPAGKDNTNAAANWLSKNKLDQLHRYTLAAATPADNKEAARKTIQVYPNPVKDKFTVTLLATAKEEVELRLIDQSGKVIGRKKLTTSHGINTIEWNMRPYAAGSYHLVLKGPQTGTVKIIKE